MKKILVILLAVLMLLTLFGCGDPQEPAPGPNNDPVVDPDPGNDPGPAVNTAGDFLKSKLGTWTEMETGQFIHIEYENDMTTLLLAHWNAEGPFPYGFISNSTKVSDTEYDVEFTVPEGEYPDDNGKMVHKDQYNMFFTVIFNKDGSLTFKSIKDFAWSGTYTKDDRLQYPDPKEDYIQIVFEQQQKVMKEFWSKYEGTWTCVQEATFFEIKEGTDYYNISFAVYCAGGLFPMGDITDMEKNADGSYTVYTYCDGQSFFDGDQMQTEPAYSMEFNFKPLSDGTIDLDGIVGYNGNYKKGTPEDYEDEIFFD